MQTKASVNYKSPKQDIWAAYQELLTGQEVSPSASLPKKLTGINNQLKSSLSGLVSDLAQSLEEKVTELNSQFDQAARVLEELNNLHNSQSQTLTLEKAEALKNRKREEEEYRYEFEKLKKRQTEDLAEVKRKTEEELAAKKAELKDEEDEFKTLRQKVATFEADLGRAIKEAVANNTAELTREFNHKQVLSLQESQGKTALLEQKIESLESVIQTYRAEITRLQTSLKETSQQLTRIAERAVEKAPPTPMTPKE